MRGRQFGWGIHVDDRPWLGERRYYLTRTSPDGAGRSYLHVVEPLTIRVVEHETPLPEQATFTETREEDLDGFTSFLQAVMDVAWERGVRPAGFDTKDPAGEIGAMRFHLEDMRALVFGSYSPGDAPGAEAKPE